MNPEPTPIEYAQVLNATINELHPLSQRTASPASMQYQYVGTIVDNTITLLVGAANALDSGRRTIEFSDFMNWRSTMKAVHRSFYSTLIAAVEQGLQELCVQEGIVIKSAQQRKDEQIAALEEWGEKPLPARIKKLIPAPQLGLMDYARAVVKQKLLPTEQAAWLQFFDALRILRNKASHANPSLTSAEITCLETGGLGAMIVSGELRLWPEHYKEIIELVLRFFDEVGATG